MKYNRHFVIIFLALLAGMTIITGSSFKNRADQPAGAGDVLYKKNCKQCHGSDGTRGMFGAKNLKLSGLEIPAIIRQIRQGKGVMPSFNRKFTEEELTVLAGYVKSLRQP
ncbi:c-type cytochrome [Chitinophaga barathri]|nr:cytochrome c [Chitinophaga barathri]